MTEGRLVDVRPAGRHALLVELPDAEHTGDLLAELLRRRAAGTLPPVEEIVPGARTVLLDGVKDPEEWARRLAGWDVPSRTEDDGELVEIPVRYDGPDLADVAARWGIGPDEVAARHSSHTYRVAFCGFAPGFGYLTGLPANCTYRAATRPVPGSRPERWPSRVPTAPCTRAPPPAAGS